MIGRDLAETNANLDQVVATLAEQQRSTGIKLLWGTANLFSHPRYCCGAGTSPDFAVFTHAAAQVKKAMDVTLHLGGQNYVFWGGREGYQSLLNTDVKQELDNMAAFLHMAVNYKKSIGATYQLLIEPKPREPMKHQYDYDVQTVMGFLSHYGLQVNHWLTAGNGQPILPHCQSPGHVLVCDCRTTSR